VGLFTPVWAGRRLATRLMPMFVAHGPGGGDAESAALGFAPTLKTALPAVVSIASSRIVKVTPTPFFNDPILQRFFGGQFPHVPQQQRERGLGSGVIVNPDGYILTNNHVIDKATDIKVMLQDKREFPGKVLDADSKTDIAVVKIAASGLPTIRWETLRNSRSEITRSPSVTLSGWARPQPWE
jgi:S1-C subfamily serine protease